MMAVSVYLLNVIDAINQSDHTVPCREARMHVSLSGQLNW